MSQKRRDLSGDAKEVSPLGVADVGPRFGVKGDVFGVEVGLEPREGRALRGHVHVPPLGHGFLNQRQGARRVAHAPIQDGHKQTRS